jgi:hypothetical protein
MIGDFGNVISSPVRIQIYNYMYRKGLHRYSRSIGLMTLHSTPCILLLLHSTPHIYHAIFFAEVKNQDYITDTDMES